jgi:hypothetical protein
VTTSRERAQAHARRPHYCSCGVIVHGNGAKAAHRGKHERAGDGHTWWTTTQWEEHGCPFLNHSDPDRRRLIVKKETPP